METEARVKRLKARDRMNSVREGTSNARLIESFLTNQGAVSYTHLDVYKRQDMNSTNFEKSVVEKLIPGLPKTSVLVLDLSLIHISWSGSN